MIRTNAISRSERRQFPHGWTMLEILVAISVIAILMAITVPAVQSVRESSAANTCLSQLRQLGTVAEQL